MWFAVGQQTLTEIGYGSLSRASPQQVLRLVLGAGMLLGLLVGGGLAGTYLSGA